jgi:hypothetical protein
MAFTVTIDSIDRTSSVLAGSLKKTDNLNQQVDNLNFTIRKYGSLTYVPVIGDEVVVEKDASAIFGGVIVRITEGLRSAAILEYKVECADYSQYLKRKLVTERYEGETVAFIVNDLVDTYTTGSDGITNTSATSTLVIESISFNRLTVAQSLQKLADAIGYVWYVDYDKDIHFMPRNTEAAPFEVNDDDGSYIYNSLEIIEDLTQLRNSVLVQGGEIVSATTRTEEFSGDGTIDVFRLANKFSSEPTVTVGGAAQTVGVEYLDDDASFDCMWNYNEKYIRFTAGNIPTSGTRNVDVTGYYLYPIVVRVPSPASQVQFGVYEFAITDKSIRSQAEAIARATAELTSYKSQLYEGQFRTYEDGIRSGQLLTINSTQRGKVVEVLVQSVTTVMRDPEGNQLEYTVRFATMKSIGIIEYLQDQLRSKEVIVDDQETILSLYELTDSAGASDTIATPTFTSPPYFIGTTHIVGYSTVG